MRPGTAATWAVPEHELRRGARRRAPARAAPGGGRAGPGARARRPGHGRGAGRVVDGRLVARPARVTVPAARQLVDLAGALDAGVPAYGPLGEGGHRRGAGPDHRRHGPHRAAAAGAEAADKAVGRAGRVGRAVRPTLLRSWARGSSTTSSPEAAEAAARAALEAEAQRAARDRHVTLSELRDGRLRLSGSLDAEAAAVLRSAIEPLDRTVRAGRCPYPGQRRHDALADVCRLALRTGELPEQGAEPAQIVVTTSFDGLVRQLGAGTLDTGLRLTPETVRRLAATPPSCRRRSAVRVRCSTSSATPARHRARGVPWSARPRLRLSGLRPSAALVRRPPHPALGRRRRLASQRGAALATSPRHIAAATGRSGGVRRPPGASRRPGSTRPAASPHQSAGVRNRSRPVPDCPPRHAAPTDRRHGTRRITPTMRPAARVRGR